MSKKIRLSRLVSKEAIRQIGSLSELPPIDYNAARIELNSNREATIDGCRGIIEYYDTMIILNIGRGTVQFNGSGLSIVSFDSEVAVLRGQITSVEYCL